MSCLACWPESSSSSSFESVDGGQDRGYPDVLLDPRSPSRRSERRQLAESPEAVVSTDSASERPSTTPIQGDRNDSGDDSFEDWRYRPYKVPGDDSGCVSCSISLPESTISLLPAWAPGSPKKNGSGRNGSPVMRSIEKVYVHWSQPPAGVEDAVDVTYRYSSPHSSFTSDECTAYCHPHELIFRTTSSPINATTYSILRRATIRTLSCEQLPRGLSCGALSFADPVDGHTIAWKFRVPDPYARGCQRHYALIALCGQDPIRSHKAAGAIWRAFRQVAASIITRTENVLQGRATTAENSNASRGARKTPMMPVSSFLTGRTLDPDGYPTRRNGGFSMRARGLAEMVGDEFVFAHIHKEFAHLLQDIDSLLNGVTLNPHAHDNLHHHHHSDHNNCDDVSSEGESGRLISAQC